MGTAGLGSLRSGSLPLKRHQRRVLALANLSLLRASSVTRIRLVRCEIDHLPSIQQKELDRAKQLLMDEFSVAISRATQPWKKNGRVLKIVLFGSYARNDWIDSPETGYQSDYDLLIIVSHPDLTDVADYWYLAEDKILRDPAIARPVNIIVHTMQEVNQALIRGEYFWVDIACDGIVLYELPGSTLATPQPLTAADAYEMASKYFAEKLGDINVWLETASVQQSRTDDPVRYRRHAAFNLHQASETAYACFLLVRTLYLPLCRTRHNGTYAERRTMPSGFRIPRFANALPVIGSA